MNSSQFRSFIEGKTPNDNGIISISQDIVFNEELIINYNNIPVEFTGKTVFNKQVTFDNTINFTFKCSEFKKIVLGQHGKLNLTKCKIDEIYYKNQYTYDERAVYGITILDTCNVVDINLDSFFGKVIIKNNKIFSLKVGGSFFLDFDICGIKSKNSIKRFNVYGNYGFNDNKGQINISNCIIDGKEKSFFAAKGLDIKLTDVEFISDVELTQPFNTFDCDESVQFKKLNVHNISNKTSESSSEALLKGFNVNELCFLETYDRVILEQLNIGSLKLNEAKELKNLTIKGCTISDFNVSSIELDSLEIFGSEIKTRIETLKIEKTVEIFCDAKDKKIEIANLEFVNCTIPKDKAIKFYNSEIQNLCFEGCLNYGNVIFTDIKSEKEGLLKIENSDLGKMIFMKCDFSNYKMNFVSSKITEIFLAGTSMPSSPNINIPIEQVTESKGPYFENKRLALTQLKKVFDNRGDSINSTLYHNAELEVWEIEPFRQEYEEKKSVNNNLLKRTKVKIFNWISSKLFPEYWNLSKENLDHKKLIFSQYKKMYEGRGDTVKAIEYQGKELDVHRTILCKEGSQYLERLQLSLNKYSNNFGQSWQWAVCWIFGLGIITYILYCRSLGFTVGSGNSNEIETFKTLFSYFFEFINPIRKGEFIKLDGDEYIKVTNSARVIDFFWRIVITYLGYQLIQAFRKYSKKTS